MASGNKLEELSTDLTITVSDDNTQKGSLSQHQQPPIVLDNNRPLSQEIAERRLKTYGENVISGQRPTQW